MFRVLCLDGGGIRGVFTAAVLASLEDATGQRIVDSFDLIAGTSTGGILAIGLALGFSAEELLTFYRERGQAIFPMTGVFSRSIALMWQLLIGPKISHRFLRKELLNILGSRKFGDARCRLVIPSYDAVSGRIYLFKTAHHRRFKDDIDAPAIDVALATAAAPTYFAAADFARHRDGSFVDGGIWANSPVLVGITEAVAFLHQPLDGIDILSVGTTRSILNVHRKGRASIVGWNVRLIDLIIDAQMEAAQSQAKLLLGGRLHRINLTVESGRFPLDNASRLNIAGLTNMGWSMARNRETLDIVSERFLNGVRVTPFVGAAE